jgi:N-formylmaleamate deformylase
MHELAVTDLTPELGRIPVPVTVVYASADASTRAALDHQFAAAYRSKPGVKLVRIENSGHLVMADQPAKFRAALGEFLK